ncbi:hypothetical protein AC1031_015006 [Aphanomyces cochlioides]|nr:hypothetical protein AC1031_015006 [Aphanomyces cochlioides]
MAGQKPALAPFQPLIWLVVTLLSFLLLAIGGKLFWRFVLVVAVVFVLQVVVFIFLAVSYVDYGLNSGRAFHGGLSVWLSVMPFGMWLFTGTEGLNTLANEVHDPKTSIPRARPSVDIGLPTGMDDSLDSKLFNLAIDHAMIWTSLASLACMSGVLLAASNIVASMSESRRLLPLDLHSRHAKLHSPIRALVCTSLIKFSFCCVMFYFPQATPAVFGVVSLSSCMGYISQSIGYIVLKRRFRAMTRTFHSPFGIPGAVYAMAVFSCCATSVLFVQNTSLSSFVHFGSILVVMAVYYQSYAKSRQAFSEDERKFLLFVHIANNNDAKRRSSTSRRPFVRRFLRYVNTAMSSKKRSSTTARSGKIYVASFFRFV